MSCLLIIGAGGHGRNVAEAAFLSGFWSKIDFLDDCYPQRSTSGNFSIVGDTSSLDRLGKSYDGIICAIGNNRVRRDFLTLLAQLRLPITTVIHPRAFVSATADVGDGSAIMAGAVVGPHAKLGVGCILNANATADHDATMGHYSHLGAGVAITGTTVLKEGAWLQVGRSAGYDVTVPDWEVWK